MAIPATLLNRMLLLLSLSCCAVACAGTAQAQSTAPGAGSTLDLSFDPHQKHDGNYRSKSVGPKKKWELDRGHFSDDPKLTMQPKVGEDNGDYSGLRLRRPSAN